MSSVRHQVRHGGRLIYEWEQSLEEVMIIITPPPHIGAKQLNITIGATTLTVGIRGADVDYINEQLGDECDPSLSLWTFSDGQLNISLHKHVRGRLWTQATINPARDETTSANDTAATAIEPDDINRDRENMIRERLHTDHPQFDFSHADVSQYKANSQP